MGLPPNYDHENHEGKAEPSAGPSSIPTRLESLDELGRYNRAPSGPADDALPIASHPRDVDSQIERDLMELDAARQLGDGAHQQSSYGPHAGSSQQPYIGPAQTLAKVMTDRVRRGERDGTGGARPSEEIVTGGTQVDMVHSNAVSGLSDHRRQWSSNASLFGVAQPPFSGVPAYSSARASGAPWVTGKGKGRAGQIIVDGDIGPAEPSDDPTGSPLNDDGNLLRESGYGLHNDRSPNHLSRPADPPLGQHLPTRIDMNPEGERICQLTCTFFWDHTITTRIDLDWTDLVDRAGGYGQASVWRRVRHLIELNLESDGYDLMLSKVHKLDDLRIIWPYHGGWNTAFGQHGIRRETVLTNHARMIGYLELAVLNSPHSYLEFKAKDEGGRDVLKIRQRTGRHPDLTHGDEIENVDETRRRTDGPREDNEDGSLHGGSNHNGPSISGQRRSSQVPALPLEHPNQSHTTAGSGDRPTTTGLGFGVGGNNHNGPPPIPPPPLGFSQGGGMEHPRLPPVAQPGPSIPFVPHPSGTDEARYPVNPMPPAAEKPQSSTAEGTRKEAPTHSTAEDNARPSGTDEARKSVNATHPAAEKPESSNAKKTGQQTALIDDKGKIPQVTHDTHHGKVDDSSLMSSALSSPPRAKKPKANYVLDTDGTKSKPTQDQYWNGPLAAKLGPRRKKPLRDTESEPPEKKAKEKKKPPRTTKSEAPEGNPKDKRKRKHDSESEAPEESAKEKKKQKKKQG